MEEKNIVLTTITILAVVGLGAFGLYNYTLKNPSQNQNTNSNNYNTQTQGKIIFGITDAAASMSNISSVLITVDSAQIHSEQKGWIAVANEPKQYDLLALKQSGGIALIADTVVDMGTYNQVRLLVSKVVVVENGVQKEATLPSGEIKINANVVVNNNSTSTVVFDFIVDDSLHVTGNGQFIFAPVIQLEAKSNADVQVNADNMVAIQNGKTETNASFGMDVSGEIKSNFMLNKNEVLDLIGGTIKIKVKDENSTSVKITPNTAIDKAISGGYLDVTTSVMLTMQSGKKVWRVSGLKSLIITNVYIDASTGAVVNY
ncbi:MAG: hypothetical protein A3F47_00365 [Candidatus Staskawiczbacteria bacterium RIFCSPHIGHO2_12_FULL_38_11]|uniref:DUF4382 domain-containing protein n=1 Tax=Candidatus Staskawiczbacteria bacterium RIFCSPHIGHO2_12_FULL_38_11 TaxID=1802209 RepID=A0A1G2I4J0_9BACT|nr:MAG: hypothetical protein A3F47_00365 [Candidatus Staskawiczbacteria bacterium RIFCSPHIGHO2_12_FULL_38_11]